jgi:hypothetical protein
LHITYEERHSTLSQRVNLPLLIHVTYPKETLVEGQYKALPPGITRVVALLHEAAHYAVLEIDILNKKVYVYEGLYRNLDRWLDYVFSKMKHCMICDFRSGASVWSWQSKIDESRWIEELQDVDRGI